MPPGPDRYRLLGQVAAVAVVAGVVGLGLWLYLDRDRLRTAFDRWERLERVRRESAEPVVGELADRVIRPGDPIDPILTRRPPTHLYQHPPFTTALYVEGTRETLLAARDGRLVWARQCGEGVYSHTFFDAFRPGEAADYAWSYNAAVEADWVGRVHARMAVAGAAAAVGP